MTPESTTQARVLQASELVWQQFRNLDRRQYVERVLQWRHRREVYQRYQVELQKRF